MFTLVDFKETAKDIFDICTNIAKADGRATEKIEEILRRVYENGRDNHMVCISNTKQSNWSKISKHLLDEIRHARNNPQ